MKKEDLAKEYATARLQGRRSGNEVSFSENKVFTEEDIEAAFNAGRDDFTEGAKWADEHPSSSFIVKVWNLATKTAIAQINKEMPYFKSENEIKEYIKKHIRL